jgi:hypothetical protein
MKMIEKSNNKHSYNIYLITYNKSTQTLIIKFNHNTNAIHKINNIEIKLDIPKKYCLDEIIYRLGYEFENSYIDNQLVQPLKKNLIYLKNFLIVSDEFRRDLKIFLSNLNKIHYDYLSNDLITIHKFKNNLTQNNEENNLINKGKQIRKRDDIKSYWKKLNSKLNINTNETYKSKNSNDTLSSFLNDENSDHLAKIYHNLIHSESMPKLLKVEHLLMIEYNDLIKERDKYLRFIQEVHQANLNEKLKPENGYSDSYISKLAMVNIEQYELEKNKWQTRIDTLKNSQQRKFRKYITKLYELKEKEDINSKSIEKVKSDILIDEHDLYLILDDQLTIDNEFLKFKPIATAAETNKKIYRTNSMNSSYLSYKKIEESYTIQLGAQLKSMHNLRLIRCDILDYCKDRFKAININSNNQTEFLLNQIEPHSIQTAMSLYSNKLCAVVLLIDCFVGSSKFNNNLNSITFSTQSDQSENNINNIEISIRNKLNEICITNGSEFHFLSNEQQALVASEFVQSVNKTIKKDKKENDEMLQLNIGDFYLTKHSNLSQAHIIFHLAANDSSNIDINNSNEISTKKNSELNKSLKNQSLKNSELSSRHPVILGLRNILKTCINNHIQTLTFPLLLTHEMTEVNSIKVF